MINKALRLKHILQNKSQIKRFQNFTFKHVTQNIYIILILPFFYLARKRMYLNVQMKAYCQNKDERNETTLLRKCWVIF